MIKSYTYTAGRFSFIYHVLADDIPSGSGFELDLQLVYFDGEEITDNELDAIADSDVYDLAVAEFMNECKSGRWQQ